MACASKPTTHQVSLATTVPTKKQNIVPDYIQESGTTIESRFQLPDGFQRTSIPPNSFAQYLRTLPLKPHGAKVHYYDGNVKGNNGVYAAVVDIDVGKKDLQQCADAVMRLRAEYLYAQKRYQDIHFNFTNGFKVAYTKWKEGNRMAIEGNKTYWKANKAAPSTDYKSFRKYMELIFMYAGTLSLSKELKSVSFSDLQIGDIFIKGGSPGHAVIIVDMAENPSTKEKIFLVAQSYMPAQDIQILQNPNNPNKGAWYTAQCTEHFYTPEWTFKCQDLKRFE